MGKIRSTITGGAAGDFHKGAYASIHHRDVCAGSTRDGTPVSVPVNSHPLSAYVESDSLRSRPVYNWETGTYSEQKLNIVENAHAQINRLKIHPVTNGRHEESEKMPRWGMAVASTPAVSKTGKKRKKG